MCLLEYLQPVAFHMVFLSPIHSHDFNCMKKNHLKGRTMRVPVLVLLVVLLIDYSGVNHSGSRVRLRIVQIGWSTKAWEAAFTDTTILEVEPGGEFGSKNAPLYFKLLEILDDHSVKIQFTDNLVVVGEPIAYPSKKNPIIISEGVNCFRIRHYDAGSDYCIDILEILND